MKVAIVLVLAIAPVWAADSMDPGISPRDKMWIASKIYASIEIRRK